MKAIYLASSLFLAFFLAGGASNAEDLDWRDVPDARNYLYDKYGVSRCAKLDSGEKIALCEVDANGAMLDDPLFRWHLQKSGYSFKISQISENLTSPCQVDGITAVSIACNDGVPEFIIFGTCDFAPNSRVETSYNSSGYITASIPMTASDNGRYLFTNDAARIKSFIRDSSLGNRVSISFQDSSGKAISMAVNTSGLPAALKYTSNGCGW